MTIGSNDFGVLPASEIGLDELVLLTFDLSVVDSVDKGGSYCSTYGADFCPAPVSYALSYFSCTTAFSATNFQRIEASFCFSDFFLISESFLSTSFFMFYFIGFIISASPP